MTDIPPTKPPSIYEAFETSPEAEEQGIWQQFASSRFRIRSANSPQVQRTREAQQRRQQKILIANGGTLPPEIAEANDIELTAALVSEWEDVPHPDRAGEMLPCTPDSLKLVLGRKGMRSFRNRIWQIALDTETYRRAAQEAIEGNSSRASIGSSAGAPTRTG